MKNDKNNPLIFLEINGDHFPAIFAEKIVKIVKNLPSSTDKEKATVFFIEKLILKKTNTFYLSHLNLFEDLYFSLNEIHNKEKYGKILFNKYLDRLDKEPMKYIKKINFYLENKGKSFEDLSDTKQKRILAKLKKEAIIKFFIYLSRYKKSKKKVS